MCIFSVSMMQNTTAQQSKLCYCRVVPQIKKVLLLNPAKHWKPFTNHILRKSISRGKLQSNADTVKTLLARKESCSWLPTPDPQFPTKCVLVQTSELFCLLTTLTWSIHLVLIGCLIRDQSTNIQQQWCQVICDKTKSWKHCKCFCLSYWYSANTGALLLFIFFFLSVHIGYHLMTILALRAMQVWAKTSFSTCQSLLTVQLATSEARMVLGLRDNSQLICKNFNSKKQIKS